MKHLGFTGTQQGMTAQQQTAVGLMIIGWADVYNVFHDGDCIGSDDEAHTMARAAGYITHLHPPINDDLRAFNEADAILDVLPYLERNRVIVNDSDRLIATPASMHEVLRSGTWATVRYARQKGIPIDIVFPDGSIKKEFNSERDNLGL